MGRVGKNHADDSPPDVVTVSPERRVTSYRIDPLIARSFMESCSKAGQSTCSVLEAFMYGFSRAVNTGDAKPAPQITVNLHMERVVQRYRRKGREVEVLEEREVQGDGDHCAWCGHAPAVKAWVRHSALVLKEPYLCDECLQHIRRRGLTVTWREL